MTNFESNLLTNNNLTSLFFISSSYQRIKTKTAVKFSTFCESSGSWLSGMNENDLLTLNLCVRLHVHQGPIS